MSQRRLAFFIHDLRAGGAESTMVRLVNGVAARGISTDLLLVGRDGPFLSQISAEVNVVDLGTRRTATSIIGLRGYLRERRPAALVSAMTHINVAAIAASASSGVRTRTVVVEHNQFSRNVAATRGVVRLAYRLAPLAYRRADVIAAVSDGVRNNLARMARLPVSRIEILHNPVVTPELLELARRPVQHKWLGGPIPLILAVGSLTRQKNFALLLEAFRRLRARREARLLILGEGGLRGELEALRARLALEDAVDLPGFHENPYAFMAAAGAFVLSSDWEGLPTVVIEALACGAPIVATDCESGPREILLGGRYGRLVPVGDAEALAQALDRAISEPHDPAPGFARANDFGLNGTVDRYLAAAGW